MYKLFYKVAGDFLLYFPASVGSEPGVSKTLISKERREPSDQLSDQNH